MKVTATGQLEIIGHRFLCGGATLVAVLIVLSEPEDERLFTGLAVRHRGWDGKGGQMRHRLGSKWYARYDAAIPASPTRFRSLHVGFSVAMIKDVARRRA